MSYLLSCSGRIVARGIGDYEWKSKSGKQTRPGRRNKYRCCRDQAVLNGQHVDGTRCKMAAVFRELIGCECGLAVRSCWQKAEPAAGLPSQGRERADGFPSRKPLAPWRHSDGRVFVEECYEAVQIPVFPSAKIPAEEFLL